ncbi:MAG: YceI family protein [Betaproteobacteria bacterium]
MLAKTHASLTWRINYFGMSRYTARFKSFDARLQYDPANAAKNLVKATIDLGSVEIDCLPHGGRDFNGKPSRAPSPRRPLPCGARSG